MRGDQKTDSSRVRIESLEYLRGLAALVVVYGHVFISGMTDRETPHSFFPFISGTPLDEYSVPFIHFLIWPEVQAEALGLNLGYIGVSTFFIISGFVIIRSCELLGAQGFLIQRAFRIVPLCAVVTLSAALVFGLGFGSPQYTPAQVVTTSLLLTNFALIVPSNPVIWTLIVEAWFYVLVASLVASRGAVDISGILIAGLACALFVAAGSNTSQFAGISDAWHEEIRQAADIALCLVHILIGSAIYLAWRWPSKRMESILLAAALLALYRLGTAELPRGAFYFANAPVGVGLFLITLAVDRMVGRRIRLLNFFGSISYPLYLVHIPLAWLLLFEFDWLGVPPLLNLATTCATCFGVAWILHRLIEMPTHRFGKRLAKRLHSPIDGVLAGPDHAKDARPRGV